jgi:hypothetical protein
VRQKLAIYAGLLAVTVVGSAPAFAQAYPPTGMLRRVEVLALVRSTGLEPLSRPVRQGPTFVLHAVNPAGREVRVVVDARLGHIVRVIPLAPTRNVAGLGELPLPPPYARPPAGIAGVPDGYGPNSRTAGLANDFDGAEPYGSSPYGSPYGSSSNGPAVDDGDLPEAPRSTATTNATTAAKRGVRAPIPRPRPKLAAADPVEAPRVTPAAPRVTPPAATTGTTNAVAPTPVTPPMPAPVYEQYE